MDTAILNILNHIKMNQTNVSKGVTNIEHRISVIFLQRKGNHAKNQPVPVQMRITINAQRIEQ
jgi:hypothetical protein